MIPKRAFRACMITTACLIISVIKAAGQQQPIVYTQYMDNQRPFNSAYSLVNNVGSVNTLVRKQWVGIDGAPTTFLFDAGIPVPSINASAGLIVYNDKFTIERQTNVTGYFAKAVQVGKNQFLAVSLNAGFMNYSANYSSLDSADPQFANDVRQTDPTVGVGVMYFSDWYYAGISVPQIAIRASGSSADKSRIPFKNHYYISGGLITPISEDVQFKPATLISITNGLPTTADISGTFYLKNEFGLGVNYRTNKQAAGIMTVNFDQFHIGYSYEFGTSSQNLGRFNLATHEVTLSYRFGKTSAPNRL
ncbi:PorP/SprF family type IX secretion system membrane protein [Mucilaginibacter sp. Mucisp86]|uniref:PorP/SprF family type IX secretion system membrane protein n=1 Tax=Mucilaginibacter sp. Mucisp86 TaxID=3243060 RepID=UPI0039B4D7D8